MTSLRRSNRARTTRQSYVEVPESDGETMMEEPVVEEPSCSKPQRGSRCRPVVIDTDDEMDESTLSSATVLPACGEQQSEAAASKGASKRRRPVVYDTDDELDEGTFASAAGSAKADLGEKSEAPASKRVVTALKRQTTLWDFPITRVPKGEKPMGDNLAVDTNVPELPASGAEAETAEANSEIPELDASGIDAEEDSDEEDEFIPGPDPNVADEVGDEPEIFDLYAELEDADVEVDEDFARKLRVILDLLCGRFKHISYRDFRAVPEDERPVTYSTIRVLTHVSVEMLVVLYTSAIPLPVQELFSKREWCLEDVLSLPKVGAKDAACQGLYANFPTGNLQHIQKMGCECYVGSTNALQRRIDDHLKVAKRHTVSSLPQSQARSFHYRTTCREDVACNFRMLAAFKRSIPTGYLTILESIFMILFGSYNYPGYTSRWATESSYEMTKEIRAQLDLVPVVWKGLNAALPLRQGTITRNSKTPSPCCNPACKAMTYPYFMQPDGPKHSRVLVNSADPLGGYLCRRCESYQERHGELPDAATLEKLTSKYNLEVAKSDLRAAGQAVVCDICGAVEGPDGAANSAASYGERHIASNGKIRCLRCDAYLRAFGKERDPALEALKQLRLQVEADREAGRPVRCTYCSKIEPRGAQKRQRWTISKAGNVICRYCYDHLDRR